MDKARPVYLNLLTIRFPCTAVISILHRMTGVILFLSLPLLLIVLQCSLQSNASFDHLQNLLALPLGKCLVWFMLSVVLCHVLAGLRHLLMDMGVGESLKAARLSATLVLLMVVTSMGAIGFLLW